MKTPQSRPSVVVMTTVPETLAAFFVPQVRLLDQAGFRVSVLSSPGPVLDGLAVGPGVARYGVPLARRPSPAEDCVSLWRLVRLLRRLRPDIVHAHTPKAGLLGMAAARLAGVPVRLYTIHGLPLLTRTGPWRRILAWVEKVSVRLATETYSVSESVRQLLGELRICPAASVQVLGDGSCGGVDIERFRPEPPESGVVAALRARYGIPPDAVVVTFVGRLARDKGIAVLAEAWKGASRRVPGLRLLLAGEQDASDPVPESVLDQLRGDARVHMTGSVRNEEVPGIYAAADFAVLPTFREGLSQMALEAGAAGVPLISCRVSGLDAVADGVTGILVPARDPRRLCDAIVKLAADAELRTRMGKAARRRIALLYAQDHVNQLWMAEYLRLAGAPLPQTAEPLAAAQVRVAR